MEIETFQLAKEFQLTTGEKKKMRDKMTTLTGSFNVSLANLDHVSVETIDTLRILAIEHSVVEEPSRVAISKPKHGFSHVCSKRHF